VGPTAALDATPLEIREGADRRRARSGGAFDGSPRRWRRTTCGRRGIAGLRIGPSEAEPFRSAFLEGLAWRGLEGARLVVSDAHEGLKAAIRRVAGAIWQGGRVGPSEKVRAPWLPHRRRRGAEVWRCLEVGSATGSRCSSAARLAGPRARR
jgi:hypothetical protein